MMGGNITGMLIAAAAFVLAFGVARAVIRWLRRRQGGRDEARARQQQSRQVRRAQERQQKKRS